MQSYNQLKFTKGFLLFCLFLDSLTVVQAGFELGVIFPVLSLQVLAE